ncbi:hypothetical protein [Cryobacterium sp. TMT2-15-1]|uniref:hypothetical protein n=1 Tax=Cryobacterium sp. TMT2-15-1 TaxID=1259246 RepID=UPI00141B8F94|nr:hypothetical protein [Cryobacterium sp. TMT2-15-1]
MTKKKETNPTEALIKTWYFPTLGLSVKADTYEEALNSDEVTAALNPAEKEEDGDVDS